jgi:hypothetical protein
VLRLLSPLLVASILFAGPAAADPAAGPDPVQTNQGSGSGSGFTASLNKAPKAGNSIVIVVGLDHANQVGTLEADDVANVIDASESMAAYQVAGAPYAIVFAAHAVTGVKTWGFHGVTQPVAWLVAEFTGVVQFDPSGVPKWDGGAYSSGYTIGGSSVSTGASPGTSNPSELLLSSFVSRVASGTAPPVASFSTGFTRLGSSVTSSNIRLDVGWKPVTVLGSYEASVTYGGSPAGATGLLTGFWAT